MSNKKIDECVAKVKSTTSDKKLREILVDFYMDGFSDGTETAKNIAFDLHRKMYS